MKRSIKILLSLLLIAAAFASCKKDDYFIGGSLHNAKFDGTTYDYLKTSPIFDTLLLLIDKTGLKDEINAANTTFFAPTDYAIQRYVKQVVQERLRLATNDPNAAVEFSDLDFNLLRDSLRAYIFSEKIERAGLNASGKYYTAKDGERRHITLWEDPTRDYISGGLTDKPQYLYFTKVIGTLDPRDQGTVPPAEQDMRMRVQTSGILTNNGVLHVLENGHIFTFATAPL